MKKFLPFFLLLLLTGTLMSQTTTLTFTGRDANNHFIPLNRVVITNLTKGWQETIYYPDTILVMSSVGIDDYGKVESFSLSQNMPNPFDGASDFSLCLPKEGQASIDVYDLNGKKITSYNNTLPAGCHVFRVLLNTAQSYVLTARSGNDHASIKIVNNGKAGTNELQYLGEGNMQSLTIELGNNTKGQTTQPFTFGDVMEYVGYAIINGQEYESQRISQQQGSSQSFVMQFSAVQAVLPSVITSAVTDITQTSATCGGSVTSDGGATVTARGVCWNTSQNPTISDNHTTDGSGIGNFTSNLTELTPGTTYYVRAFATNSVGTAYGEQQTFMTTSFLIPAVATDSVTDIAQTSATCGGNVTSDGGATVTARGVCWNTSQNPTISDNHTTDGSGIGNFTSNLTGITPGTTYYVRAYATNSVGTAYGEQKVFTTLLGVQPCPNVTTVTDYDGNVYNTVQIGQQCWMRENLKTTHYANGTSIAIGSSASTTTAYRYYPNNNSSSVSTYGYLYNWKAVMNNSSSSSSNPSGVQGICPTGWHVPSDAEWTQLKNYVSSQSQYVCGSGSSYIAKALASTTGWYSNTNTCAVGNNQSSNNATGFSAAPAGGYYGYYGDFSNKATFWSSTELYSDNAYYRGLFYTDASVNRSFDLKYIGFSVRCVKD